MYDYPLIEGKLRSIVKSLQERLSNEEQGEVLGFVDAGEYGIGFETLCSILADAHVKLDVALLEKLEELGNSIGIDPSTWRSLTQPD